MTRTRLFSGSRIALGAAILAAIAGCGTTNFPDNVLEGNWTGQLVLTGSLKVGDETQTLDPKSTKFDISFDAQGIPKGETIGQTNETQGGFDIHDLMTPGDSRNGSINSPDATGTAKLTCIEASFSAASMHYVFTLEIDVTVTKGGSQYPSTSKTTTTINASVAGQTCSYVTDTLTEGSAPVETPPDSGMFVVKSFTATTHGEGELSRG